MAYLQQIVFVKLSLGIIVLGLGFFSNHVIRRNLGPGVKGSGLMQSRLARMLHHECDAILSYRLLGGPIVLQCSVHVRNHVHPLPN